jgi:hypothetical protein
MTERIFQILAVVLMAAAVYLFWADNKDYGFAALVLSCCSYFLSYRFHLKESAREREAQEADDFNDNSAFDTDEEDDQNDSGTREA